MNDLERIRFSLIYNPKVRNVKKPVSKCVYGSTHCYYHEDVLKINQEKCTFKHKPHCHRYLSERCCQWQLVYNKRFNKGNGNA